MDPRKVAFGFGRRYALFRVESQSAWLIRMSRICPGIHLAEISVLVMSAMLLAVYDISDPRDETGILLTPATATHTGGTIRCAVFRRSCFLFA